jgi:hypothetical protein
MIVQDVTVEDPKNNILNVLTCPCFTVVAIMDVK